VAGGFRIPALLRHDEQGEALVLERLEGSSATLGRHDEELHLRIGKALERWQATPADGLERFGAGEELEVLRHLRGRTAVALGELPLRWEETYVTATTLASDLPRTPPVLCHRDLHDGQIG